MRDIIIEVSDEAYEKLTAVTDVPMMVNGAIIESRPLIRCKNCKYWEEDRFCAYRHHIYDTYADDFCSRGERK